MKKLEDYCNGVRLPFSLIYWAANIDQMKRLGYADDSTWLTGIMSQGYAFAAVGGHPDQFVDESWTNWPSHSVPETADYTFTAGGAGFWTEVREAAPMNMKRFLAVVLLGLVCMEAHGQQPAMGAEGAAAVCARAAE